jgi:hypothetical protein
MKYKAILWLFVLFLPHLLNAQEENETNLPVNKKGQVLVPQKGDIAIGLTAGPIFRYMGNFFNSSSVNLSPDANNLAFLNDSTRFMLKYMLSDKMAARVTIGFNTNRTSNYFYVRDDGAFYKDPLSNVLVKDKHRQLNRNVSLAAGIEKRSGKGRMQGYYGIDVFYQKFDTLNFMEYANPISELNQAPSSYNFLTKNVEQMSVRPLEEYSVRNSDVGANLFFGTEYFLLPGIALGAEMAWQLKYENKKQVYSKSEYWNGSEAAVRTEISQGDLAKGSGFETSIDNLRFGLFLMFYF